jgi:hypothetical protein
MDMSHSFTISTSLEYIVEVVMLQAWPKALKPARLLGMALEAQGSAQDI